ncbi:MAG: AAA family ATPase [Firmicutes bacterium]|nr:AAA family ATPase [Bacillota bacterium]
MQFLKKYQKIFGVLLILILVGSIPAGAYFNNRQEPQFINYTEFITALSAGQLETVQLSDAPTISFTLTYDETIFITNNPRREGFKEYLLLQGVAVSENAQRGDGVVQLVFSIALIAGVLIFLSRRNGIAKAKSGINTVAVQTAPGQPLCGFNRVAGNPEAKESIMDIVDYLRNPQKFARYGARMPRGILFHGRPGTGKTLMARAMAGEAGVPFYAVSGSDFVQMYVGVGAARVRELFKKAREAGRGVIFIDEIDALGKKRSGGVNGNDEREQTLNALLTEMQGFSDTAGIVVVAATNRPDTLDEALMRPGRFDRRVEIGLPDLNARKQIIQLHAKGKPLSQSVDLDKLASDTVFFSGAMLEGLLNDAAINAARRASENIEAEDIDSAYYTALAGSEKKDRSNIREKEREVTAWHESGHAITALVTDPSNRVAKVTIIPSTGGAGGFCVNIPQERMYYTKQDLRHQIMVSLAGRAAEELHFGPDNVTTGASNDIEKTTSTAMQYVTKFGMGNGIADVLLLKDEQKAARECEELLDGLYMETVELLRNNFAALEKLAAKLLVSETVDGDEIVGMLKSA